MFKFVLDNLFGVGAFLGLLISPILAFELVTNFLETTNRGKGIFLFSYLMVVVVFMVSGIIKQWVIDR